ncbi:MAG: SAM-dependent methyltransferase, partial [Thermoflexales bacterium]
MPLITLLGLGPGDPQLITGEARAILERCDVVYLRTSQHPAVAALPPERLRTFDHLYQDAVDFADVYRHIA